MGAFIGRVTRIGWVAHLLRAIERFNLRLGTQFAGAITYFSVLAMVPILMFGFSLLGMTLTVLRPDLLGEAKELISAQISSADSADQIMAVITRALENWRGVGLVAILTAGYSGANWLANMRHAVNAMWRRVFDVSPPGGSPLKIVTNTLRNLGVLLGLLLLVVLTLGISAAASGLTGQLLNLLGLGETTVTVAALRGISVVASLFTGWVLFVYLYTLLPVDKKPFAVVGKAAIVGSVGLAILQYFAALLTSLFTRNQAAALFGPVIVLMLFFNFFAQLILLGASWAATADPDGDDRDFAADPGERDAELIVPDFAETAHPTPRAVPALIAARGVRVGTAAGYLTGTATGVGLGAIVARVLAAWAYRKKR